MQIICSHCAAEFTASKRQAKRQRATTHGGAYCSPACAAAATGLRFRRDTPTWGPCPQCGAMFQSKQRKKYCDMKCYMASPDFAVVRARALAQAHARQPQRERRKCLHCGIEFFAKPSRKQKFCCKNHRREYMAERFDRWIAAPESIALPQAYDEFLSKDELPCLVEGCNWRGKALSGHMNFTHGVPAREFKRAAGFNLQSGIIGAETRQIMEDRPHIHNPTFGGLAGSGVTDQSYVRNYISKESVEHRRKAIALLQAEGPGPERLCLACGASFWQTTKMGVTKYCSLKCRIRIAKEKIDRRIFVMSCSCCSNAFRGKRSQRLRAEKGLIVVCSFRCRQILSGRRRGKKPALDAARAENE